MMDRISNLGAKVATKKLGKNHLKSRAGSGKAATIDKYSKSSGTKALWSKCALVV